MKSKTYRFWRSISDSRRCVPCKEQHGQVYSPDDFNPIEPPLHERCRCRIEPMEAKLVGTATKNGLRGADWWLKQFGHLPDYYISVDDAKAKGWKPYLGNLSAVAPGKMLIKGRYYNNNHHLPETAGRIWYEADINYTSGYRRSERILFSNDGLIFVTYDHYMTFVEIV